MGDTLAVVRAGLLHFSASCRVWLRCLPPFHNATEKMGVLVEAEKLFVQFLACKDTRQ
jgi:hypothetical protein